MKVRITKKRNKSLRLYQQSMVLSFLLQGLEVEVYNILTKYQLKLLYPYWLEINPFSKSRKMIARKVKIIMPSMAKPIGKSVCI
jgi:hypothetical protein